MRRWRVGSFSMGVTLILVGISLLMSMQGGGRGADFLLDWWPVVFLLLGGEVLVHLFLSREKQPILSYDLFSILIVGFLCVAGAGFAVLTSSGVMDEIKEAVGGVERSVDLPELREALTSDITKVVISSQNSGLQVKREEGNEVYLFGTYRQQLYNGKPEFELKQEDVATFRKVASTLYVDIKQFPRNMGLNHGAYTSNLTLLIPHHKELELNGDYLLLDQEDGQQ